MINDAAWLLLEQALLIEGMPVENPGAVCAEAEPGAEPGGVEEDAGQRPTPHERLPDCIFYVFLTVKTAEIFSRSSDTVYGLLITPASALVNCSRIALSP